MRKEKERDRERGTRQIYNTLFPWCTNRIKARRQLAIHSRQLRAIELCICGVGKCTYVYVGKAD